MLLADLDARIERGELVADPQQRAAAARLERLAGELAAAPALPARTSSGLLGRLLGARPAAAPAPRGVYLHGGVGRGKSMLMDLFFAAAPLAAKRRVHFHEFMLEVQRRLHELRQGEGVEPMAALGG